MSIYSITPADFAFDQRVKDKHRQVMLAFGVHSSRKHWIKLSQAKMADELGIARETVNRAVKDLVDWGYLEKRSPEQTGKSICFYRIVMSRAEPGDEAEETSIEEGSDQAVTSDQAITGGCDRSGHRGVTVAVTGGVTKAVTPIGSKEGSNNTFSAPASASDKGARSPGALEGVLIRKGDPEWLAWMIWADDKGCRTSFEHEGAIVAYAHSPRNDVPRPKLPPMPGTDRRRALEAARTERLAKAGSPRGKMFAAGDEPLEAFDA